MNITLSKALVRAAQEAGEKLYFAGMLDNYEAVTKDSLKTSVATCASNRGERPQADTLKVVS